MPALLIGLGGIGSGTIRRVYNKTVKIPALRDKVTGDNPSTVFVQLDMDLEYDADIEADLKRPPNFWVDKPAEVVKSSLSKDEVFKDWWIKSYTPPQRPLKGITAGGQIRINGRLCLYKNFSKVKTLLHGIIKNFQEVGNINKDKPLKVFIVSSLGGGTGAGMFIDIGFLVQDICKELNLNNKFTIGFFFDGTITARVAKATDVYGYAALTELDYWMKNFGGYEFHGDKETAKVISPDSPPFELAFLVQEQTETGDRFVGVKGDVVADYKNYLAEALFLMIEGEGTVDRFIIANGWNVFQNLSEDLKYGGLGISIVKFPKVDITKFVAGNYLGKWENGYPGSLDTTPNIDALTQTEWNISQQTNMGPVELIRDNILDKFQRFNQSYLSNIRKQLQKEPSQKVLKKFDLDGDFLEWKKQSKELKSKAEVYLSKHYKKVIEGIKKLVADRVHTLRFDEIIGYIKGVEGIIDDSIKSLKKGGMGVESSGELLISLQKRRKILLQPGFDPFGRKKREAAKIFIDGLNLWVLTLVNKEIIYPMVDEFYNRLKGDMEYLKLALENLKGIHKKLINKYKEEASLPPLSMLQLVRKENKEYPLELELGYTKDTIMEKVYEPVVEDIQEKGIEEQWLNDLKIGSKYEGKGLPELLDEEILSGYLAPETERKQKIRETESSMNKVEEILRKNLSLLYAQVENRVVSISVDDALDWYFEQWRKRLSEAKSNTKEKQSKYRRISEEVFGDEIEFLWKNTDGDKKTWNERALRGILGSLSKRTNPFIVLSEDRNKDLQKLASEDTMEKLDVSTLFSPANSRYGRIIGNFAVQQGWNTDSIPESDTRIIFYKQESGFMLKHLPLLEECREEYLKNLDLYSSDKKRASMTPIHADVRFYDEFRTDITSKFSKEDISVLALAIGFELATREKKRWYYKDEIRDQKVLLGSTLPDAFNRLNSDSGVLSYLREKLEGKIQQLKFSKKDDPSVLKEKIEEALRNSLEVWGQAEPPKHLNAYSLWEEGERKITEYISAVNKNIEDAVERILRDVRS